jgi:ATP-dependent Lon protease
MVETADEQAPRSGAMVRMSDQPPAVLPTLVLGELVPFPGPVVPVSLDVGSRREAVLQAKNNSGYLLLINRRAPRRDDPLTAPLNLLRTEDDADLSADGQELAEAAAEALAGMEQAERRSGTAPSGGAQRGDRAGSKKSSRLDAMRLEAEMLSLSDAADAEDDLPITDVGALNSVGVVARLIKVMRLGDERITALLQLQRRAQPIEILSQDPCLTVRVSYPAEVVRNDEEYQALYRQVRLQLQAFFGAHPTVSDDLKSAALAIDSPGTVADFVAQHLSRDTDERLALLEELNLTTRMRRALEVTLRELDLLTVGNRMSQEIRDKVEKHQRDFLLREQLKAIRSELGEEKDPSALAQQELREKLDKAKLPPHARLRADEELTRLALLPSESPEHHVVRSYIECIAQLPWSQKSEDIRDLQRARAILDEDHYGLEEVKERITEFLAVHQLNPDKIGTLLCFSGPPGVGKTSLGKSIARAMGRKFYRFSVGGMRDEAEIKGHRRTYVGAMPGRILQALRQVKTNNPVFMLDELDKMGSDWRGDPASALLEVLDPAQNNSFGDHYLDLSFDLSRIMFIATANIASEIPPALRDRLEIIELSGYIPEEKLSIANRYLLPRQRKEHGLRPGQLQVGAPTMRRVILDYTHEAGVRELNRQIGRLCRKRAVKVVDGDRSNQRIAASELRRLLGPPKKHDDFLSRRPPPGVARGLAWTPVGGAVLTIEAALIPGKGNVKVTGQLGDVMNESANLAVSYVKMRAVQLGVDLSLLKEHDIHLHFPAGAVKKDGPSAGITVTTALISLLTKRRVAANLAMTGEITLQGNVLPVGGVREKVVAARAEGLRTLILPSANRADVGEIPPYVSKSIRFIYADTYQDVVRAAFDLGAPARPTARSTKRRDVLPPRRRSAKSQRVARSGA